MSLQRIPTTFSLPDGMAMPLRLICYATGNTLSPRVLVKELAKADPIFEAHALSRGSVGFETVQSLEWRVLLAELQQLNLSPPEAVQRLPSGVFIWVDALEYAYDFYFAPERREPIWTAGERATQTILQDVLVDASLIPTLWDGFPSQFDASSYRQVIVAPKVKTLPQQEEEILAKLKEHGYDPLKMPKYKPGRPSAKQHIKDLLGTRGIWAHTSAFDKAWHRLRSNDQIRDV